MKKVLIIVHFAVFLISSCSINIPNQPGTDTAATGSAKNITYQNPVLPGDYADPSVVRVGDDYWATATSSEWAPLFPILHSKNLVTWETVGHIFPNKLPAWAEAHFWAPEITYEKGKYYIYYTAKKKGGNLCVGVASAIKATGPYTDLGPLICQEVGSIDGFPIRDENGELYLIWKEDANSVQKPTPLWGQRMNEERTALLAEKFELFRNDPNTWEGGLVEGPALVNRNGYFYLFYAGDACCGRNCTYGVGVARAKSLRGPWEKHPANPIMLKNEAWKCPGHGTLVSDNKGNDYFLYHAYSTKSTIYPGRQGLLDKVNWNSNNWPSFQQNSPSTTSKVPFKKYAPVNLHITDEFNKPRLDNSWQWSVTHAPKYTLTSTNNGQLKLQASPDKIGSYLGQRTLAGKYTATASVQVNARDVGALASLVAIGDPDNAIGLGISNTELVLWEIKRNQTTIMAREARPQGEQVFLRLMTENGDNLNFSWSIDGRTWIPVQKGQSVNAAYLPPWDRGIRVGLAAKGPVTSFATFNSFIIDHL